MGEAVGFVVCGTCYADVALSAVAAHIAQCSTARVAELADRARVEPAIAQLFLEHVDVSASANEISDGVFLGSARAANADVLAAHGITVVVNAAVEIERPDLSGVHVTFLRMEDLPTFDPSGAFEAGAAAIDAAHAAGARVLVHCAAGVSRTRLLSPRGS